MNRLIGVCDPPFINAKQPNDVLSRRLGYDHNMIGPRGDFEPQIQKASLVPPYRLGQAKRDQIVDGIDVRRSRRIKGQRGSPMHKAGRLIPLRPEVRRR